MHASMGCGVIEGGEGGVDEIEIDRLSLVNM
jgi:hypothetical protein